MESMKKRCINILRNDIIPFWNKLRDDENGGFYGQMDNDLVVDKQGGKGVILNSRILWFYSQCAIVLRESDKQAAEECLKYAAHAFDFCIDHCVDSENGGVYWMMKYDGTPLDTMKHTYNQAFAIYALSTYYLASDVGAALDLAFELFETVESKCRLSTATGS